MPIPEVINEGIVVVPGTGTSGKHPTSRTQSGLLSQLLNLHPNSFPPGHPYQVTSSQDVTRPGNPSALTSSSKLAATLPLAAQVTAQAQTIPENSGIRHFIWEHLNDVHHILHRLGHTGAKVRSWPPTIPFRTSAHFHTQPSPCATGPRTTQPLPTPRRPLHNNADCVWEEQHDHAIQELKDAIIYLPSPIPIDHKSSRPVFLAIRLVLVRCRMDPLVAM